MPREDNESIPSLYRPKFILPILILLGALLFIPTYLGIQKSRSDSLAMIRSQGTALLESLVLSSDNAIKANSLFDLLVQEKFADLTSFLESRESLLESPSALTDLAARSGVEAVLVYDADSKLKASGARGPAIDINTLADALISDVDSLLMDSSENILFYTTAGDLPGNLLMYYLKKSDDERHVIAIVSDALFYNSAKEDIGIGYLLQNIAREVGIEYIVFQTEEGIIFSSKRIGPVLKIEKDPFLQTALLSDTALARELVLDGRRVLELARPFASVEYPTGIFRLGLSLEKYYGIMRGFDRQMIVLSLVIFAVIVFVVLYLVGKQKRIFLDRSFRRMKTLSEKVFESINSGVIVVSKDGTVELANRQALAIFAVAEEGLVGRVWKESPFSMILPFDRIFSGQQSSLDSESILEADSGRKYLLINLARLTDHFGQPSGAVAVIYDYTAIRELEENARRKERLTELGDLAAGVAHEVRNPLNAISIAAQRLLAEFQPEANVDEFRSFVGQIRAEAGRLNEIVTRFLSLARGASGGQAPFDISRASEETCQFLKTEYEDKNVTLETKITPDLHIRGSSDRLKQMIMNLVRNGYEACRERGGQISVELFREDDHIVLIVRDNGSGIPEPIRSRIFNPYFTTKEQGTGLGLSIVHQIVEEFRGKMQVLSPSDGGTEFRITFPAA